MQNIWQVIIMYDLIHNIIKKIEANSNIDCVECILTLKLSSQLVTSVLVRSQRLYQGGGVIHMRANIYEFA